MRQHVLQALVIDTMQRLFRAWKTRLHADYFLYDTDEERLSHRPDDITPEDWVSLAEHFGSLAFKAVSERNKLNRGKQTTKHSCGSKSFAEVEESTHQIEFGNSNTLVKMTDENRCGRIHSHNKFMAYSKKLWLNNNLKKMSFQLVQMRF
ncbi:uncharacterized protein [Nicotiana tomentosiformis]|uniref:uncharacterized protein isoform X1 n=1 Tax=Nicotiana tomentosiformis TaxID=4098 RepID=UPI00388CC265